MKIGSGKELFICSPSYEDCLIVFRLKKTDRLQPATVQTISEKRLVEAIDEQTLEYSIQLEMRAMSRLLMIPETLERLRLSACQPWRFSNLNPDLRRKNLNQWIWGLNPQYKVKID